VGPRAVLDAVVKEKNSQTLQGLKPLITKPTAVPTSYPGSSNNQEIYMFNVEVKLNLPGIKKQNCCHENVATGGVRCGEHKGWIDDRCLCCTPSPIHSVCIYVSYLFMFHLTQPRCTGKVDWGLVITILQCNPGNG
jgi:hypothetical protein